MPGPLMKVRDAIKKYGKGIKVGIKKIGKYWYIRTETGRWRRVTLDTLVWHRGRGKWSVYTGSVDKKVRAKVLPKKRYNRYRHTGDVFWKI